MPLASPTIILLALRAVVELATESESVKLPPLSGEIVSVAGVKLAPV
jgi:hypothetical protein